MSHKKFRTLATLLLTTIFLFTFCFSNLTFATTTSDGLETVEEGVYYIRNAEVDLYLNNLDGMSVVLSSFVETSSHQWELIYVSNGYYYIKNVASNKYLTAPANSNEGSYVEQTTLNASIASRQLWSIEYAYYGDIIVYIRSQSQEAADLYTASTDYLGAYGYNVIQSYDVQFKSNNNWYLERGDASTTRKVASLFGISPDSTSCDHQSIISSAANSFTNANYLTNAFAPVDTTVATVSSHLQNSDIFILYTHGYYSSSGTYAYLNSSNSEFISSSDIYDYDTGAYLDMSRCEVAVFASCYSSNHSSKNLPLSAVHAGAECAIGFDTMIMCSELGSWIDVFAEYYLSGSSAAYAAEYASQLVGGTTQYTVDYYAQGG